MCWTGAWHRGRVVLIGDAAHSCPPTLAQGAAQALEDAAVLAELLISADRLDEQLWAAFTARRFERAKSVVEASNQLGQWLLDHVRGDVPGPDGPDQRHGQRAGVSEHRSDERLREEPDGMSVVDVHAHVIVPEVEAVVAGLPGLGGAAGAGRPAQRPGVARGLREDGGRGDSAVDRSWTAGSPTWTRPASTSR